MSSLFVRVLLFSHHTTLLFFVRQRNDPAIVQWHKILVCIDAVLVLFARPCGDGAIVKGCAGIIEPWHMLAITPWCRLIVGTPGRDF